MVNSSSHVNLRRSNDLSKLSCKLNQLVGRFKA